MPDERSDICSPIFKGLPVLQLMKRPEEGALGGPVLAGNPVTDPMVAGVGRSAPSAAIAPPGATQADWAVEPAGIGPTRNQATAI